MVVVENQDRGVALLIRLAENPEFESLSLAPYNCHLRLAQGVGFPHQKPAEIQERRMAA